MCLCKIKQVAFGFAKPENVLRRQEVGELGGSIVKPKLNCFVGNEGVSVLCERRFWAPRENASLGFEQTAGRRAASCV